MKSSLGLSDAGSHPDPESARRAAETRALKLTLPPGSSRRSETLAPSGTRKDGGFQPSKDNPKFFYKSSTPVRSQSRCESVPFDHLAEQLAFWLPNENVGRTTRFT